MKETIYTIPVMEAIEKGGCLFCNLYEHLEESVLNYITGPSVAYMQDDIREKTDKMGFCPRHYKALYEQRNRLGLALILHTHMKKFNRDLEDLYEQSLKFKGLLFGKKEEGLPKYITEVNNSCYVCENINSSYDRYISTFFEIFKKNEEIAGIIEEKIVFCVGHMVDVVPSARKYLSGKDINRFLEGFLNTQASYLKGLEADLEHFVKKFDYRFKEEPWGNSKDSIERTIKIFCGINNFIKDEKDE